MTCNQLYQANVYIYHVDTVFIFHRVFHIPTVIKSEGEGKEEGGEKEVETRAQREEETEVIVVGQTSALCLLPP